jgi:hypothetical protein
MEESTGDNYRQQEGKLQKSYKHYIEIQNRTGLCKEPRRESRIDRNGDRKGAPEKKLGIGNT